MNNVLSVSEIFYSIQGEGARIGQPSIFIRLQGCKTKHACYAAGVRCDTNFEGGSLITVDELRERCLTLAPGCPWIIWTGGEPTDQLTSGIVAFFGKDFRQAIETSGLNPVPPGIEHVCVSPKVAEHVLAKNFPLQPSGYHVDELRYVVHAGSALPAPQLSARYKFLSPHFDGATYNRDNINHTVNLCLSNPEWRLSVQMHKLLNVL